MNRAPWLPRAALERWLATGTGDLQAWFEWLLARMVCSGGRLGGLLIEAGLCELGDIAACVAAQLSAGPLRDDALRHDLDADLSLLTERLPLGEAAALSARIVGVGWLGNVDWRHAEVADRLLAAGREAEALVVLSRVEWHAAMLDWIERHGDRVSEAERGRLLARTVQLVETTHLPREYQVGLFVRVAVLFKDARWISRAREVLVSLPAGSIEGTPDLEHPLESLASGLAQLGDFAGAMTELAGLPAHDRWSALLKLLPWAPDRGALLAELTEGIEGWDWSWAWLVDAAPELGPRALRAILAMDAERRAGELAAVAGRLRGDAAREACAWLLAAVDERAVGSAAWAAAWEDALDAMTTTGCEGLMDEARRFALIDELLARPDVDLWVEAGPFVPASRAEAVLAAAYAGLAAANHYTTRERWIAVGLPLLAHVPAEVAERWLALAATQLPRTGMDGKSLADFAAWTPAQQRTIVLERLAQHQHEFLVKQVIEPWLVGLARALPGRLHPAWDGWVPDDVLARQRERGREEIVVPDAAAPLAEGAWPEIEQVVARVAGLGEAATAAARGLVTLLGAPARA